MLVNNKQYTSYIVSTFLLNGKKPKLFKKNKQSIRTKRKNFYVGF